MDILDSVDVLGLDEEDYGLDLPLDEGGTENQVEEPAVSVEEAKNITDAIRSTASATYVLLAQAHEQKVHKVLGYTSWADYVKKEFDMSAQRSYQLLDLKKVVDEIENVAPDGTKVKITEAQARDIKRELPNITEKIRQETEGKDPDDAKDDIERIIEDAREQKRQEKQELLDPIPTEESTSSGQSDDYYDDTLDGVKAPDNQTSIKRFFNVFKNLENLPDPEVLAQIVPANRRDEVAGKVNHAIAWLEDFKEIWDEH